MTLKVWLVRRILIIICFVLVEFKVTLVFTSISLLVFVNVRVTLMCTFLDGLIMRFRLSELLLAIKVTATKVCFDFNRRELLSLTLLERSMFLFLLGVRRVVDLWRLFRISMIIFTSEEWFTIVAAIPIERFIVTEIFNICLRSKRHLVVVRLEGKRRRGVRHLETISVLRTRTHVSCRVWSTSLKITNHDRVILTQFDLRWLLERIYIDGTWLASFSVARLFIRIFGSSRLKVFSFLSCDFSHTHWLERHPHELLRWANLAEILNLYRSCWTRVESNASWGLVWWRHKCCRHERLSPNAHEWVLTPSESWRIWLTDINSQLWCGVC